MKDKSTPSARLYFTSCLVMPRSFGVGSLNFVNGRGAIRLTVSFKNKFGGSLTDSLRVINCVPSSLVSETIASYLSLPERKISSDFSDFRLNFRKNGRSPSGDAPFPVRKILSSIIIMQR